MGFWDDFWGIHDEPDDKGHKNSGMSRGKHDRKGSGTGPGKTKRPAGGYGQRGSARGPSRGHTRRGGARHGPQGPWWFPRKGPK